ncbi:MAG: HAD-IIB family hydrolase [Bulleidia sp.]
MGRREHIFISDLDGTLFDAGTNHIRPGDLDAVKAWIQSGNSFWAATGRGLGAKEALKNLGIEPEVMIFSAGTGYQIRTEAPVRIGFLDHGTAEVLLHLLDQKCIGTDYSADTGDHSVRYARQRGILKQKASEPPAQDPLKLLQRTDVQLLRVFCRARSEAEIQKTAQVIEAELGSRVLCMHTDAAAIDIIPAGCSKWTAEKAALDALKISPSECAAIGDQQADADMIRFSGIGFSMSGADEEVRKSADYIVDSVSEAIGILGKR